MTQITRMTVQRRVILDVLRASKAHPTAEEVFALVRKRLPRISLGTVYRNLDVLCRSGDVKKLEIGGSRSRFDGNIGQPHDHVRCVYCGCVRDVSARKGGARSYRLGGDAKGFKIFGRRLCYLGICPDCRRRGCEVPHD